MRKGQANIKYVIETGHGNKERPTEADWNRLLVFARIFNYVKVVLLIRSTCDFLAKNEIVSHEAQIPASVENNKLLVSLWLSTDFDVSAINFELSNTVAGKRYLSARFDEPLKVEANETMQLEFHSPATVEAWPYAEQTETKAQLTVSLYRH